MSIHFDCTSWAKDSGFVANPGCFDTGMFTVYTKEQKSDTKLSQIGYESYFRIRKSLSEFFLRKFESDKTSRVYTLSVRNLSELTPLYSFQIYCH